MQISASMVSTGWGKQWGDGFSSVLLGVGDQRVLHYSAALSGHSVQSRRETAFEVFDGGIATRVLLHAHVRQDKINWLCVADCVARTSERVTWFAGSETDLAIDESPCCTSRGDNSPPTGRLANSSAATETSLHMQTVAAIVLRSISCRPERISSGKMIENTELRCSAVVRRSDSLQTGLNASGD